MPSFDIPIDETRLLAVLLASVRVAAFVVVAPPFSHRAFPARVKAMLSVGMGLAVSGSVDASGVTDAGALLLALVEQLLIGGALGFLVYLVFAAVESAGSLVDLFGGFQLATAFDPQLNVNGAQFARLFQLSAVALLFSSGAYQVILAGFARTFASLPVGAGLPAGLTAQAVVEQLSGMFVAALQIAGPLVIVLFLADLGLGLLNRVAPALNAFSLSYPLKMGLTVALAGIVFVALPAAVQAMSSAAAGLLAGRFG